MLAKMTNEIDAGPIYLKKKLLLDGSAEEIFIDACKIIKSMICEIISNDLMPKPQKGKPTYFKRRQKKESNISNLNTQEEIYNHIRMLDAENYPKSFIKINNIKIEFYNASKKKDVILAQVIIKDIKDEEF